MRTSTGSKSFQMPNTVPTGIRQLPFTLLRNDLDPRRREAMRAAFAHYEELRATDSLPPQLMPQRMLFQMHKTNPNDPNFGHQPWDNSALSWGRAVGGFSSGVPSRVARVLPRPPALDPARVAAARRGGARTPQPDMHQVAIINRAVRATSANSSFHGRFAPPAGGVRSVDDLAQALPISANARVMAAFARTMKSVRK